MTDILSRCVLLKNLPPKCDRSMLEIVLQVSRFPELETQIEDVYTLHSDAQIVLFKSSEDAEKCLSSNTWVMETGKGVFYITAGAVQDIRDIPMEWMHTNVDTLDAAADYKPSLRPLRCPSPTPRRCKSPSPLVDDSDQPSFIKVGEDGYVELILHDDEPNEDYTPEKLTRPVPKPRNPDYDYPRSRNPEYNYRTLNPSSSASFLKVDSTIDKKRSRSFSPSLSNRSHIEIESKPPKLPPREPTTPRKSSNEKHSHIDRKNSDEDKQSLLGSHGEAEHRGIRHSWTPGTLELQIVIRGAPAEMSSYDVLDSLKNANLVSERDIVDMSYRPIEKEVIFLCQTNEVAERILDAINVDELLLIDGAHLTAIRHSQYPYETNKMLISGLTETMTNQDIDNATHMLSGHHPNEVYIAKDGTSAMVSFDTPMDLKQIVSLNAMCKETKMPYTLLPIRRSRSIKLQCHGHGILLGEVEKFFDYNKDSETGLVTDIYYKEDTDEFVVTFNEHEDALQYSKQAISIGGRNLPVAMYYPCVELHITVPAFLYPMSPYLQRFIQMSEHYKNDIMDILGRHRGEIQWHSLTDTVDYLRIVCTTAYTDATNDQTISTWTKGCTMALEDICKRLGTEKVYVATQEWQHMESFVNNMTFSSAINVELVQRECSIVLSGELLKVESAAQDIQREAEQHECMKVEKRRILKDYEFDILEMMKDTIDYPKELCIERKVSYQCFKGAGSEIVTAMKAIDSALNNCAFQIFDDENDLSKKLLNCVEARKYICQKLKDDNVTCVFGEKLQQICVFGKNDDEVRKAIVATKQLLKHKKFYMDKNIRDCIVRKEGEVSLTKLEKKHEGLMKYSLCEKQLEVTCVDKVFTRICDEIELLIEMQIEFDVFLNVEPGALEWIDEHHESLVSSTIKKFETPSFPMTIVKHEKTDKCGYYITGLKWQCKEAMLHLMETTDAIVQRNHSLSCSNFDKFLTSAYGVNELSECETTSRCVVKYSKKGIQKKESSKSVVAIFNLQSCSIDVTASDSTMFKTADYLVRPSTNNFDFKSDQSVQILTQGGNYIHSECERRKISLPNGNIIVTSAGQLKCYKGIIHAFIEKWSSMGSTENEKAVSKYVLNCMHEADKLKANSIVFPLVCGKGFSYPIDTCAKGMLSGIKNFWLETGMETPVKKVNICDEDEENLKMFAETAKQYFDVNTKHKTDNTTAGRDGFQPVIIKGYLEEQQVDVIVNATNTRLDLRVGNVSKQLMNVGGSSIQTDCRTKYPKGIKAREIARTSSGTLKCKELFHGTLDPWDEGQGYSEMVLRYLIGSCLQLAHKSGYTSIAFPVLGAGMLRFPPDVVAKAMFEEVKKFGNKNLRSTLTKVNVVIFPKDNDVITAFDIYQNKRASLSLKAPEPTRSFLVNAGSCYANTIGPVTFYIRQGDITSVQTTAFVNVTSENLQLDVGNVSRMVLAAAGNCIQHEAGDNILEFKANGLAVTSAGRLFHRKIIHIKGRNAISGYKKTVKNCLAEAENLCLTSLAFPLLGTGCKGFSPEKMVRALCESFSEYITGSEYKSYLKSITLVVYKKGDYDVVISEISTRGLSTDIMRRASCVTDRFRIRNKDVVGHRVIQNRTFHIHSDSSENIAKAVDYLDNIEIHTSINLPKLEKDSRHIRELIVGLEKIGKRIKVDVHESNQKVFVSGFGRRAKIILEKLRQEIEKVTMK